MQEKSQNTLLIINLVLLIVLGISILLQQGTIRAIKAIVMPAENAGPSANALQEAQKESSVILSYLAQGTEKALKEEMREITGKVAEVSENSLAVEGDIVDLAKIKEATSVDNLPKTKKTYHISFNSKTEFLGKQAKDIKTDDSINVLANELVYQASNLTATRIICPFITNATASAKPVSGTIEKIDGSVITIKSTQEGDAKTYNIQITGKTKLFKNEFEPVKETVIKLSDIKTGDVVIASPTEAIGDKTSFEAGTLRLMIYPPAKQ